MKRIFVILSMLFVLTNTTAEVIRKNNTFKITTVKTKSEGEQTKYVYEDDKGNKYPIFVTKNGTCYIKKVSSKSGKEYRQYIPKEIKEIILKELNIENKTIIK